MIRRAILAAMFIGLATASPSLWSYDSELAASYAELFELASGAQTGKALHLMTPEVMVKKVNAGETLVILDVRTPAETRIFGATLPNTLTIPLNELFQAQNLARIPTDRPVVVLCQTCVRAAVAATGLRHIGLEQVFILQGGYKALASYLGPKTAGPSGTAEGR